MVNPEFSGHSAITVDTHQDAETHNNSNTHHEEGISLAGWNWEHVKVHVVIILFIIFSGVAKLAFHKAHWLSSRIPESCLLIILGIVFGGIVFEADDERNPTTDKVLPTFTSDMFFLYLLPPIILEASWSLYNTNFFNNIRAILLLAVVGTVINFLLIGGLLLAVVSNQLVSTLTLTKTQIFLFSSIISAVDPVAVLSIFTEVGVNPHLYFLVFGESLLNDGVAVVLYKMMTAFAGMEYQGDDINAGHILIGICSFLTIALGGLAIGIIVGLLVSLLTRLTKGVRIIEPLALFGGGYLAYILAELVHWSGIISLIGCGLVQAHYAFRNISAESRITVNYFIKMLSSTSDCVIFLYLGISWFTNNHVWDIGFILWTLFFCLLARFVSTYLLCYYVNWLRRNIHPITLREMLVMAYGGLRGAVGFSLVITINCRHVEDANMLITTTLVVIMQTVFLQGSSIKWLVNKLKIEKSEEADHKLLMVEMNHKLFDHIMSGVESLAGKRGQYYFQDCFNRFDEKFLMKIFCSSHAEHDMVRMYDEASIADHYLHLYDPSVKAAEAIKEASGHENPGFDENKKSNVKIEITDNESRKIDRESFMMALEDNPLDKLFNVVDKNLTRVEDHDITYHLKKRKNSAKNIRRRMRHMSDAAKNNDDFQKSKPRSVSFREYNTNEDVDELVILRSKHQEFRQRKTKSINKKRSNIENSRENKTTGL